MIDVQYFNRQSKLEMNSLSHLDFLIEESNISGKNTTNKTNTVNEIPINTPLNF